MNNKGNTLGIVVLVLAVIALLWFFSSGKRLVLSKPAPNTITAAAINTYPQNSLYANSAVYSNTATQVYPYSSGKLAYVTFPISSSSSSSNYSTYYPAYNYPRTYTSQTYYPPAPSYGSGGCYVGGCSSQLCTDQPGAVSTCEYRPEYSCYSRARCERQANGACGWTPTSELYACLNTAY
jgi:hypothetical protein